MADFVSTEDLAYAAGIIDGEGYIGITVLEKDKRRAYSSPSFQTVVNVGMADPEVVIWLQETFGGNVHSYGPGSYGTKRGVHHWRLAGPAVTEFCRMIRPYLRLKHRQAELILRYREDNRLNHTRHGGRGVRVPLEETEIKRLYQEEIKSLNQRKAVTKS